MNRLIASEEIINSFLSAMPELEKDEVIFLALFQRNKHLILEQRKELGLPRCNVIARAICREKSSIVKQLRRWESDERAFLTKTGVPIPNECLVPYITVQPISMIKTYQEFNRIATDYLIELSSQGDRSNTYSRIKKLDTLLLDCAQHAYSRKIYIDVDFDVPKDWALLKDFEDTLFVKGVKYLKIETQGGFHYLLSKDTLKFNYHEILDNWRAFATQEFGKAREHKEDKPKWEIEVSENQAVPIPGTFQYGFYEVGFTRGER